MFARRIASVRLWKRKPSVRPFLNPLRFSSVQPTPKVDNITENPNQLTAKVSDEIPIQELSAVEFEKKIKATSNWREKIKLLWKKYGIMFVVTYLSVYGITLTSVFATLDFGLLNASSIGLEQAVVVTKVSNTIESMTGIKWLPNYLEKNPRLATLAVAWVATKFTEPLRLGITVVATPTVARKLMGDKYK